MDLLEMNSRIHNAIFKFVTMYNSIRKSGNHEQTLGLWLEQELNIPRYQRDEFKKYRKQHDFCKKNMVLPENFTGIVHEPFGGQSKPDLAIFYRGRPLMIDVKTSKNGKPVYNSVPPRTDEFIIFINTKATCEEAFAVSGADLLGPVDVSYLGGNADNLHNYIHTEHMKTTADIVNQTVLRDSNLSLYCRAMFNPKYRIKMSSPKFFTDILNYDWSVIALPDVHSFEDGDEDE